MLKTRIPYNIELIEEIKENGAIVDLSSPDFPGIAPDKQLRTTLVFLRNTGFEVRLDFSKCSYKEKRDYLILYLKEKIEIKNREFADSWYKILMEKSGFSCEEECILSDEELVRFISEEADYIDHVINFIYSLPLYAMKRYTLEDKAYNMDSFDESAANDISDNICFVLEHPDILCLYMHTEKPMFYTKIFTIENNKLFDAIQSLPFMSILFGLGKYDFASEVG